RCSFRITAHEFCQLVRLGQDLVVQHFNDVVLLNPRRGGRSIGYDVVNDESETLGQTELLADDVWHFGSFYAEKCDRYLRHFFMPIRRPRWRRGRSRRRRWCLCKSCQGQKCDGCDDCDQFCFHLLLWLRVRIGNSVVEIHWPDDRYRSGRRAKEPSPWPG